MEPVSDAGLNVSCCMCLYGSWSQVLLDDRFQRSASGQNASNINWLAGISLRVRGENPRSAGLPQ
jgi:hypothetical protein